MEYKTPGVYVEEISTLPPSVAGVATAIPAFIGYTETGPLRVPTRISNLLEYEQIFGGADVSSFSVTTSSANGVTSVSSIAGSGTPPFTGVPRFLLYYQMQHFFRNGGGSCYIISLGNYGSVATSNDFSQGLAELEKEDEPTLILLSDAVQLDAASYYNVCQEALAQCAKLGDRFCIFDVRPDDTDASGFRSGIGINALKYGAAYTPYLNTSIPVAYEQDQVSVDVPSLQGSLTVEGLIIGYTGPSSDSPVVIIRAGSAGDPITVSVDNSELTIAGTGSNAAVADILSVWEGLSASDRGLFTLTADGASPANVTTTFNAPGNNVPFVQSTTSTLRELESSETGLYNQIKLALSTTFVSLPPSAAIAGIYANVDRTRGVWKAPANVSISTVTGPSTLITHEEQENLNVDAQAGKSINAIRSFAGKGTLIWGARTLAGNDNEWRYINVRRLFNMIEESVKKATAFAVFEGNDATTWLKVKGMIESYLYGLWQQGALAGPTPEAAYFVNVGLGRTMTTQDILEGRMIVEIGIAAVRPAEFIILKFSHKLQEA